MTGLRSPLQRLRLEWLAVVIVSAALLAGLIFSDLSRAVGNSVYDMALNWVKFQPSKDIIIVTIDDRSLDALGGWPLSRKHYTDLLALWDNPRCKPQAIGFDLLFLDASAEDVDLAEKMAAHKVVLPVEFRWDARANDAIDFKTAVLPIRSAASFGHINIAFDSDGVVRRFSLRDRQWPHFSVQMQATANAQGNQSTTPASDPASRSSRGIRMPASNAGYTTVSLSDALISGCASAQFKDKFVLIGVTAPSLGDRFPTSVSVQTGSSTPGVEILAASLDAVQSGALIRDVSQPWLWLCSAAAVLAFLVCFLFTPLGYLFPLAVVIQSAWFAASTYLLQTRYLWLDPVPGCLVMIAAALAWAMVRHESVLFFMQKKTRDLQKSSHAVALLAPQSPTTPSIMSPFLELSSAVSSVQHELEFLSLVVNEMPEAVAVYNDNDELLLTNRHIQSLFEVGVLTQYTGIAKLLEQLQIDSAALNALTASDRSPDDSIHVFGVRTVLGERDFSLKSSVIRGPEGSMLRLLFLADVTELRKHQIQRDRTLRFLSHDMRTPIAAIISLIRLNTSRSNLEISPAGSRQMLQQARTLLQMVDDFTFTVSAEVGNFKFKDELLETLLNDALEQVMPLAHAKGQRIEDINPAETVFVTVDTRLFIRALVNLLANAIKFAPPDSTITLDTRVLPVTGESSSVAPKVCIEIRNEIQSGALPSTDADSIEGFGIGLSFVENVLRKHFGTIQRHIPASGIATISLRLPCNLQN